MVSPIEFATHTELAEGLRTLVRELEKRTDLHEPTSNSVPRKRSAATSGTGIIFE